MGLSRIKCRAERRLSIHLLCVLVVESRRHRVVHNRAEGLPVIESVMPVALEVGAAVHALVKGSGPLEKLFFDGAEGVDLIAQNKRVRDAQDELFVALDQVLRAYIHRLDGAGLEMIEEDVEVFQLLKLTDRLLVELATARARQDLKEFDEVDA